MNDELSQLQTAIMPRAVGSPRRLPLLWLTVILTLAMGGELMVFAANPSSTWSGIRRRIAEEYPRVASLTTMELAHWLEDTRRHPPVLIDVRSRAEYDTSHLAGARWAETPKQVEVELQSIPVAQPVVLYCSVGWRSAQAADRLRKAGREEVFNLDGSIFQWANEGRPLVREGQPVTGVHPYNAVWGRLLDRRRWAGLPNTTSGPAAPESPQ